MATHPKDLAREVFGGSESELSSDDEDFNLRRQQQKQKHPRQQQQEVDDSSTGESDEDDYREAHPQPSYKSRLKESRRPRGEKPQRRKRKRREPTEIDLSELPPEQAKKIQMDMRLEAILKPKKSSRPRKKQANDEVLDSLDDDEVARLRDRMIVAAEEDCRLNNDKQPAMAKLRMLPEVIEKLHHSKCRPALSQSIADHNLLEAVKRWLEPLPDRSLPALNIQRELFTTLKRLDYIDSAVLKDSGLGRVVLFYTKCKRVTSDIAKIANELVSIWSRPIIKRSASYRDKVVPTAEGGMEDMRGDKLNAILARTREHERQRVRKNAVMIPQQQLGLYTVAPRANAGLSVSGRANASVDEDVQRRKQNAERLRILTRKVRA